MRMELPQSPSVTALACGLGHAAALTAHWAVIHSRVAACGSLIEGACDVPFAAENAFRSGTGGLIRRLRSITCLACGSGARASRDP